MWRWSRVFPQILVKIFSIFCWFPILVFSEMTKMEYSYSYTGRCHAPACLREVQVLHREKPLLADSEHLRGLLFKTLPHHSQSFSLYPEILVSLFPPSSWPPHGSELRTCLCPLEPLVQTRSGVVMRYRDRESSSHLVSALGIPSEAGYFPFYEALHCRSHNGAPSTVWNILLQIVKLHLWMGQWWHEETQRGKKDLTPKKPIPVTIQPMHRF